MSYTAALEANLSSYWSNDLLERYGSRSSGDSASFKESIIAELQATGALPPASAAEGSDPTTTTTASTGGDATTQAGDEPQSSGVSSYVARSNFYDFTTDEWKAAHPGSADLFATYPELSAFLGDNPVYGSMFVNDGAVGTGLAINAYLMRSASADSGESGSTLDATA